MNNKVEAMETFIADFNGRLKNLMNSLAKFLYSEKIGECLVKYKEVNKQKQGNDFNIFKLISDTYYKENFHSKIIAKILNLKINSEKVFLRLFLEYLAELTKDKNSKINVDDFKNAIIRAEKWRIDVSIVDEVSKKAIIIENKIYNADDQPCQLPHYYNKLKNIEKYSVVSIPYISLNGQKKPVNKPWKEDCIDVKYKIVTEEMKEDIKRKKIDKVIKAVNGLVLPIAAFSDNRDGKEDMCSGWLDKCILEAKNLDVLSVLRQYRELLRCEGAKIMLDPVYEMFYDMLKEKPENLVNGDNQLPIETIEIAKMIVELMNGLPEFMAKKMVQKIKEKYQEHCSPFKKVLIWKDVNVTFQYLNIQNLDFAIDFCFKDNKFVIGFFETHYGKTPNESREKMEKLLKEANLTDKFPDKWGCGYSADIEVPLDMNETEEKMYKFIDDVLEKLKKSCKQMIFRKKA